MPPLRRRDEQPRCALAPPDAVARTLPENAETGSRCPAPWSVPFDGLVFTKHCIEMGRHENVHIALKDMWFSDVVLRVGPGPLAPFLQDNRSVKRNLFVALIAFVLLGGSSSAWAATKTWNGSASTSWNNVNNWSPSGLPGASDDVLLNS